MYVAITRAKEKLFLTRSRSRYLYGKREPTARSQFVNEIADRLDLGEERVYPRYSGDYYRENYGSGYGYGSGGYGRSSSPVRVSSASAYAGRDGDEGFRTFGGAARPNGVSPRPAAKPSAPVRYGNVGTKPASGGKDVSRLVPGVTVRHARFGTGVIVARRGSESNPIVTVKFETAGNKDLAATLAPLEIVSEDI